MFDIGSVYVRFVVGKLALRMCFFQIPTISFMNANSTMPHTRLNILAPEFYI